MSLFWIKIIALLTMATDHLGVFFFPENIYLRIVGRLSFPLFAWAIANGARHTKNIYRYLLRLFLLALASQIPYFLLFETINVPDPGLNILFTLSLGLLGIILFNRYKKVAARTLIACFLSLIAFFAEVDYGAMGVMSIIAFYVFYGAKINTLLSYLLIVFVFHILPLIVNAVAGDIFQVSYLNILQTFSLASLVLINNYSGGKGFGIKWFFYLFYPLHLFLMYLVTK